MTIEDELVSLSNLFKQIRENIKRDEFCRVRVSNEFGNKIMPLADATEIERALIEYAKKNFVSPLNALFIILLANNMTYQSPSTEEYPSSPSLQTFRIGNKPT